MLRIAKKSIPSFAFAIILLFSSSHLSANEPCTYDPFLNQWTGDCPRPVVSAVPFLRIGPDARTGALGDAGIALSPDANSIHYNASKLVFAPDRFSLSATYTPWLRGLVRDIYLAYIGGYYRLDDFQALGFSLRYFSLGDIQFTDQNGQATGNGRPNEFDVSLSYSRKLGDNFSAGVTGRFIYSNLAAGQTVESIEINAATAAAVDISLTYNTVLSPLSELSLGVAVTNLGSKVSYTRSQIKDFLPGNLGIGAAWNIDFDDFNRLTFVLDFNKLLVPTPLDPGHPDYLQRREQSVMSGVVNSFSDAGSLTDELREINIQGGIEYWYMNQFAVRAGYHHEHALKGNRKFLTLGFGVKYNIFGLNFSYLVPTNAQRNPLDNTLRFSLIFDMDNFSLEG
ncbi:MAG: hypothetical protein EA362_03335 [Saprospirales bacterium]|nr:MAG: hypothetical protein EA362_03335 [Saprospirales bacterium]